MKRRTISLQLLIRICLILLFVMAVNIGWDIHRESYFARQEMLEKARLIAGQFVATRTFIAARPEKEQEPTNSTDQTLQRGSFKHLDPRSVDATLQKVFGEHTRVELREVWYEAATPENRPEELEKTLLSELASHQNLEELHRIDEFHGTRAFIYMVPLSVEEGCLECHGNERHGTESTGSGTASKLPPRYQLGEVVGGV